MMISYYKDTQEINERNYIYILKFLAVTSIVAAHVTEVNSTSGFNYMASMLLKEIANYGVAIFLLVSGYLFCKSRVKYKVDIF